MTWSGDRMTWVDDRMTWADDQMTFYFILFLVLSVEALSNLRDINCLIIIIIILFLVPSVV